MIKSAIRSFAWPALAVVVAASALYGCGDVHAYKLDPGSFGETEPAADWNGTVVELAHMTTPCDSVTEGPRAWVGDHMEFPNCAAAAPKSSCASDNLVAVAIDVQPRGIIYDFANIGGPGIFERADFNGYVVVDLLRTSPRILEARIDRDMTTLDLEDRDVVVDGRSVHANFEGLRFENTDFVKINLVFAEAESL